MGPGSQQPCGAASWRFERRRVPDLMRIAPARNADIIETTTGISMHPAAKLQFERIIVEFARWRALPEDDRPPAPAWWWGPAVEMRDVDLKLPAPGSARLGLPDGATYADGARVLFRSLAGQTIQPWPYDFSSKVKSTDSDVRDLHVQPSDDSAFQP
jgi:hypothetical protein